MGTLLALDKLIHQSCPACTQHGAGTLRHGAHGSLSSNSMGAVGVGSASLSLSVFDIIELYTFFTIHGFVPAVTQADCTLAGVAGGLMRAFRGHRECRPGEYGGRSRAGAEDLASEDRETRRRRSCCTFCSALCSPFVPGRAATPRRHHPPPGDARTLAESDTEIRLVWTAAWLGPRHEFPNSRSGAAEVPVAASPLEYNVFYASVPAPRTGRCQYRLPGYVQKGVVSPFLAFLPQIGNEGSVQRTSACTRFYRLDSGWVSFQFKQQGWIDARSGLDESAKDWGTGPERSKSPSKREFSAAKRWAGPSSTDNSNSNTTGNVLDANKCDKRDLWITDSSSRGLVNAIDLTTEGWNGCYHVATGNSTRSRAQHLSGPSNICPKPPRLTGIPVATAAYYKTCLSLVTRTERRIRERNISLTGRSFPYHLSCKNITVMDTYDLNAKLKDEGKIHNQKYPPNQGKAHGAGSITNKSHVLQYVTDFTGNPFLLAKRQNKYPSISKPISCCNDSESKKFSDSKVNCSNSVSNIMPHFQLSAQLNMNETFCDLQTHSGTWNSNKNSMQSESAPEVNLNFVQSLIMWNYNSNNNNNKQQNDEQNNSGSNEKSRNDTRIVQTNKKNKRNVSVKELPSHVQCPIAHLGSVPLESPHPAYTDSTTSNNLDTNREPLKMQLKSGRGLPLQAETVSEHVEQFGVSRGRRKGETAGEVREEEMEDSRGKGNRQYGAGGSKERVGRVNGDSTKKEVLEKDKNLLEEEKRGRGSAVSQTMKETVEKHGNKNWQQPKKTQAETRNNQEFVGSSSEEVTTGKKQTEKESNKRKFLYDYEYFKAKPDQQQDVLPVGRSRRAANRHPHFPQYNYQIQVAENQPPSTSVISIVADDPDPGEAGRLSYSMAPLMNSRSMDYFQIDPLTGLISTTHVLDREHMDLHYFRITAIDHGSPRLSGTTMVAITVSDRNDHSPIFEQTEYRETIRENVEEGYPILQLRATDLDSQANANIRYRFIGESAAVARSAFEIDPRSGLITTRGIVDREANEHYTLQVEANDQGREPGPRSATVNVHITVLDENDNVPQFSQKRYIVAVREDVRPHSEILRVSASDEDKDGNAAVHYNIISGNSRGQFAIDSVTGEIQVVAPLDFETEPTVLESAPTGHSVLHIQAIDTDSGDNARLEYRLTGTGTDTPFVINAATGWVTVSSELDREMVEHYFFGVEARDYGIPTLSATAR
ncbi:Cadherin EGF LAG seven-pass G-type receptor 3 [Bagarius yarrelli]|uniref:Cadherin EGF LAG seven-pass G-type receptor 3 n=1 Tax=Bagarius yarrelli TaxID=175774 RepID=A0A556UFF9_BAGYA|nr:Cadherin EGF LAG seven-pass G-type receptor 3 [Bagarius yarrelli]